MRLQLGFRLELGIGIDAQCCAERQRGNDLRALRVFELAGPQRLVTSRDDQAADVRLAARNDDNLEVQRRRVVGHGQALCVGM